MNQIEVIDSTTPVELGVADEVIAGCKGRLAGLNADTHQGYLDIKAGILELTRHRTGVDKSRKALKKSALDWGRKVEAEAKRVTGLLLEIETPLREKKALVDDEAERKRKDREEEEQLAIEAKALADREALEAEQEAQREEERKEREAEAAKLAEQRKELEADRRRLEDERREQEQAMAKLSQKIRSDREKIEAEKREARVARDSREAVEREELEAEEREKAAEAASVRRAAQQLERQRIAEVRKPDVEKLRDFGRKIEALEAPEMKTDWGRGELGIIEGVLLEAAIAASCQDVSSEDDMAAADAAETVHEQSP